MAYIYENDVGRLGGNLQKTVAYLLSLHKAEYEWNLLGIKVVGHVDALPIPDGTYEYGDAYTVGTDAPYDMWIYTRADEFHSEAYWFPIGKFPMPGPQGPKGDGLEQIIREASNTAQSVSYDSTSGATIEYAYKTLIYKDSTTGETKTQTYPAQLSLPIIPGKYVSIDATADNDAVEVKVDDTELSLDYYKIDKAQTTSTIPYWSGTKAGTLPATDDKVGNSIVKRDATGSATLHNIRVGNAISDINGGYLTDARILAYAASKSFADSVITKTATDKGTLDVSELTTLQNYPQVHIKYDNQIYYRMDPLGAPDGTLNYIHIDGIEDGNGGYKATGKCFRITVGTREWKVFDLDFGGKVYQHAIHFELTGEGTSSTANVWDIELVITTSSPNKIKKNTLYKYISTSGYPLQGGTPISVYRQKVEGPQGMGIGRMSVQHEVGEISNTDHYIFELMSMDGISETITERDQNGLDSFVDKVTEV